MLTWAIVLLIRTEFGDPIRIDNLRPFNKAQGRLGSGQVTPLGCVLYFSLFVSVLIAMLCDLVMLSIAGQMALAWAECGV